ncbi:MAG: hypothetical protein ACRCXZ_02645, partial [Patescibacteria group bacterium]
VKSPFFAVVEHLTELNGLTNEFKLSKQTPNKLHFGLILFEMTLHQFALRFHLKNISAFIVSWSEDI